MLLPRSWGGLIKGILITDTPYNFTAAKSNNSLRLDSVTLMSFTGAKKIHDSK
jgi:hypothetical protein